MFNSLTTGFSGLLNLFDATSLGGEAILTDPISLFGEAILKARGGEKALIPAKMFTRRIVVIVSSICSWF